MKYSVDLSEFGTVTVEADDRWSAVRKAGSKVGFKGSLTYLFAIASVRKLGPRKNRKASWFPGLEEGRRFS